MVKITDEPRWCNLSAMYKMRTYDMDDKDRDWVLKSLSKPVSEASKGELGQLESISFLEEVAAALFLFFFVGSMFWLPIAVLIFAIFVRSAVAWIVFFVVWLILSTHPVPRMQNAVHSR